MPSIGLTGISLDANAVSVGLASQSSKSRTHLDTYSCSKSGRDIHSESHWFASPRLQRQTDQATHFPKRCHGIKVFGEIFEKLLVEGDLSGLVDLT